MNLADIIAFQNQKSTTLMDQEANQALCNGLSIGLLDVSATQWMNIESNFSGADSVNLIRIAAKLMGG